MLNRGSDVTTEALEALYRERFVNYLRVAEGITGSEAAGLDAVQDGFVNALRKRSTFRGEAAVDTWVWRCVVNAALSIQRQHREVPVADPPDTSADGISDLPHLDEVKLAVRRLPRQQKAMLFLRYFADLDYVQIADILSVRVGTVGATLATAQRAVRRSLEEVHDQHV